VLYLAHGGAGRPLGDPAQLVVLHRAGQQLFRRRRRAAATSSPIRVNLAVAPLRRHGDSAARCGLLPGRSARAPDRCPRDLGDGSLRGDARGLAPAQKEPGRSLSADESGLAMLVCVLTGTKVDSRRGLGRWFSSPPRADATAGLSSLSWQSPWRSSRTQPVDANTLHMAAELVIHRSALIHRANRGQRQLATASGL